MQLDVKDKKILFELDRDAHLSTAAIGRKVGLSQEVVFHRIRRLVEKGIIMRFQTVVAVTRLGYIASKIYLQLQNMDEKAYAALRSYLLGHKQVFWFCICQGRWDMLIAYWSKSASEFGDYADDLLNKFSPYILERQITIGKNTIQFNRQWFYADSRERMETEFGAGSSDCKVGGLDTEILRYLANNARLSMVQLAKLTGSTVNKVLYSVKQLERNKIICGRKIALNIHSLGYETCKSFIFFKNITRQKRRQLITYCKMHPHIINIVLCVGPWDLEIEFEVENFDQFYDIMTQIKNRFGDIIKNYESVVFKEEPKQSFMPGCYPQIM